MASDLKLPWKQKAPLSPPPLTRTQEPGGVNTHLGWVDLPGTMAKQLQPSELAIREQGK